MEDNLISIYTDGACSGNPGPGGYGIVMISGPYRKEFFQGYKHTTNNRMELLAVIIALEKIKTEKSFALIYSDSKYVVDAVNANWINGWVKRGWKNVKNVDLWKRFITIQTKHNVRFVWVKGHASNVENNRCDILAVKAARQLPLLVDEGFVEEHTKQDLF